MKRFADETVLDLIGSAYEAALKPELWPTHLEKWRQTLRGGQARFVIYDMLGRNGTVEVSAGVDPYYNRIYRDHFASLNPWVEAGLNEIKAGQVVHGEMLLSNEELLRTEFYNDFLRPQDVLYCSGSVLFQSGTAVGALIIERSARAGRFTDEELDFQKRMLPHLQRAAELHRRLAEAEEARAGLLGKPDTRPAGAILVDSRARVISMNRHAAEVFEQGDGVTLGAGGEIQLSSHTADAALEKLVGNAAETAGDNGLSLQVGRPSGKTAYELSVIPLAGSTRKRGNDRPRAIVQIEDRDAELESASRALQSAFGLTNSEAALALRLAQGRSVADSAVELNVSLNTVRTHLKRIFSKTDTRRQAELVSLLLTSSRPGKNTDNRVRN